MLKVRTEEDCALLCECVRESVCVRPCERKYRNQIKEVC